MNDIDFNQIIKWIIIVLVAGFIGQFGKSFAQYLMRRAQRKKEEAQVVRQDPLPPDRSADAKLRKKEQKALLKQKKKEAKKDSPPQV